jgi:protoporphyrinogen oxidase
MGKSNATLPVAVLGAGPVGLAAAAHLVERGMTPLIFEAGAAVAANLQTYRHVRLFSVGAGHSAAGTLLALAQLAQQAPATRVVWAIRGKQLAKVFDGGAADGLPARGELGCCGPAAKAAVPASGNPPAHPVAPTAERCA